MFLRATETSFEIGYYGVWPGTHPIYIQKIKMEELPTDIWLLILQCLDAYSLCTISSTCKSMHNLCGTECLWTSLLCRYSYYQKTKEMLVALQLPTDKDKFRHFYTSELDYNKTIVSYTSEHKMMSEIYFKIPRNKPTLQIQRPDYEHSLAVLWEDGKCIIPETNPFRDVYCPNCKLESEHLQVKTKYQIEFANYCRQAGDCYTEIYCQRCHKYTIWANIIDYRPF